MHSNINGFPGHVMNSGFQWGGILWNLCKSRESGKLLALHMILTFAESLDRLYPLLDFNK